MKYTTLLIDLDDTLLDFGASERAAITQIMRAYGIEEVQKNYSFYEQLNKRKWQELEKGKITREELKATRFCEYFEAMGVKGDGVRANAEYMTYLSQTSIPMENAVETCKRLKEKGCKIYIITNGSKSVQDGRLKESPLSQYFDGVFVSEEIGYSKPQKEYFDYVLSRIDEKDKSKLLVVGDSLSSDIKGAEAAGLDSCWVNKGIRSESTADYQIANIGEIFSVLDI